jgi:mono/diheme cytochrome c family protein
MRSPTSSAIGRLWPALAAGFALASCTADRAETGGPALAGDEQREGRGAAPAAGFVRTGASFAAMADQYAMPRPAGTAATGASAWVAAAPAPAFVATGPMPPAGPQAPTPAAVANRQPGQPAPSAAAAEIVRPEAAAPEQPAAAAPNPAVRTRGLALFNAWSCGTCHVLADAGAAGAIGPSLDRNPRLTRAFVIDVVSNGRGAMPSFGGQMSDAEIAALADYLVQFARK